MRELISADVGPWTSGTHQAGERKLDSNGTLWFCTVTGTPGNWVCGSPGTTIDYLEWNDTRAATATTVATALDVGLVIAPYSTGVDPMIVECHAVLSNAVNWAAGSAAVLSICDTTVDNAPTATNEIFRITANPQTTGQQDCPMEMRRIVPPSGYRTIKGYLWVTGGAANMEARLVNDGPTPNILWARWA